MLFLFPRSHLPLRAVQGSALALAPHASAGVRVLLLLSLAACSAPQSTPALSRNALAMQSAEAGTLGEPALVEFYTTECISCRAIRGQVSALDQRYDGKVKFIYLDIDLPESQPFLARYNVRGVPTIALLDRKGRLTSNMPGWLGEQAVTDALDRLIVQP